MKTYSLCRLTSLCVFFFLSLDVSCCGKPFGSGLSALYGECLPHDMTYLRDGLGEMLASRLSAEAGVVVVDRKTVNGTLGTGGRPELDQLHSLAEKMGADFLLYDSITALSGGMSFDARLSWLTARRWWSLN